MMKEGKMSDDKRKEYEQWKRLENEGKNNFT